MECIASGIQVQLDLPWWLLVGLDKYVHQQPIQCPRVRCDLLVAVPGRRGRVAEFQSIEGAGNGQRIAAILLPFAVFTGPIGFVDQQCQATVRPPYLLVTEILLAQCQALRKQGVNTVLDTAGIAVIGEATVHPVEEIYALIALPQ